MDKQSPFKSMQRVPLNSMQQSKSTHYVPYAEMQTLVPEWPNLQR